MNEPTHLDLYSGIGGFSIASEWAGFRTIAFAELGGHPRRRKKRIETLAEGQQGKCFTHPPKPLRALEERGWITIRSSAEIEDSYSVEITDTGLTKHTELMIKLRA